MEERIFLYGTLRPGHAPPEIAAAVSRLRRIDAGTVRGCLYDLGAYTGMVLDDSASEVRGEVFAVPDAETLARCRSQPVFSVEDGCCAGERTKRGLLGLCIQPAAARTMRRVGPQRECIKIPAKLL
jgi:hypothetical protein